MNIHLRRSMIPCKLKKKFSNAAAINSDSDIHLLDHIAPLAEHLNIPLIVKEKKNFDLVQKFYPTANSRFMPDLEFELKKLADEFDTLIECKYWKIHLKKLFLDFYQKKMDLVFCPHGQSDKGRISPILAPYAFQDSVFLYGKLMLDMLKSQKIPLKDYQFIGNYRFSHYKKHKQFYKNLFQNRISLDSKKKTVLYAPTWNDLEKGSSFFSCGEKIMKELPHEFNLILKLHPLLEERNPIETYRILRFSNRENIYLLDDFPPIFPILDQVDIYLGDASSIGYDFLAFQKPMFFIPSKDKKLLQKAGKVLDMQENIYSQMSPENPYKKIQTDLYKYAFIHS